jgi:hypothetical protein
VPDRGPLQGRKRCFWVCLPATCALAASERPRLLRELQAADLGHGVTDQLSLFEEDMTDLEREGLVADFLAQQGREPLVPASLRPKPCICERPMLFVAELGEGRCGLCGREAR